MVISERSAKVCFIIPQYDPDTSTHFNYLYEFIENLRQELDIFLIIENGEKPSFLPGEKVYVQKFKFLPLRILENLLAVKYARLCGYKDFYIHYSFLSALNASLIVKFLGGRTFYWNCGLPWKYKRSLIRETFELLTYKLITYLVTGTEGLKKEYADYYKLPLSKIKVLPNWIDIQKVKSQRSKVKGSELRKKLDIPAGAKVLLFAHRLSRRKGAHYLSEILNNLRNENIVLVIAGDGPERKNIESNVKGQMSKVRFIGWIPQNEIMKYFSIADTFILPSEEEGFPHVLLEAMAGGVPFVAFDVGGVREVAPSEFSEYIIASADVKSFSGKIKEILHYDGERIGKLSAIERDRAKQFDLSGVLVKFKDMLLN